MDAPVSYSRYIVDLADKCGRSARLRPVAVAVAMACSPALLAQEQGSEPAQERVVVVGSRIPQPDFIYSNPVTSLSGDLIQYAGTTNLLDFVQEVPALGNSIDSHDYANAGDRLSVGLNLLNLRNLGEDRTLVLVNGRRHVAGSPGSAAVDINSIPIDLIERVEVLTGGASALYGADGVSGVVNFVLRDDFEGITSRVQVGQPSGRGGDNTFASVLGGHNFADGRANFTASIEYSSTDPVNRDDRDYSRLGQGLYFVDNPADPDDDPAIVDQIVANDVRYLDTSPYGSLWTDFDFDEGNLGIDYTGYGDPWVPGEFVGSFRMLGGSGSLLDQFVEQLLPGQDRVSVSSTFRFDLSSSHSFFAEATFVQAETTFISQPTYDFVLPIELDNAFAPAVAVAEASDPFDGLGVIEVARDNIDLGPVAKKINRDTTQLVVGFNGDLPLSNWTYEVSY